MDYRYQIGDTVRVIDKLVWNQTYGMHSGPYADISPGNITIRDTLGERQKFCGGVVTIDDYDFGNYLIKEDNCSTLWSDDMFLSVESNECWCNSLL